MNAVYLLFLAAVSAATITPSSQSKELPGKTQGQTAYLTEKAAPFSFTIEGPAAVILKLRGPKVIDATTQFPIRIIRNDKYQTQYSRSLVARRVAPRGYPYGTEIGIQVPAGQQTYTLDTGATVMAVLLSSPKKLPKRLAVKVAETAWVPPTTTPAAVVPKKTNPAAKPKVVKPVPAKIVKRAQPERPVKIKRILIMDVSAAGVDEAIAKQVTAAIAESMSGRTGIETVTSEELTNIAETEVLKQGTGCEADTACMAEISSWANAELVVNGTLGKVGDAITITLSLVDSKNASVENRVSRSISETQNPIDITQSLVEELFGWDGAGNKITYRIAEGKAVSFAVFDLSTAGLSEDAARNLTQVLSVELKRIQGASVIGKEDIAAMLNLEGQKQVLGCDSDTSCLAEIGGALGVDKLVVGQVGKLADNFIISLALCEKA